ncbi:MAG: hypothetical protein ABI970_02940, partial [Chloroflexota bacterium]
CNRTVTGRSVMMSDTFMFVLLFPYDSFFRPQMHPKDILANNVRVTTIVIVSSASSHSYSSQTIN